jgi:hypothetical protein
MVNRCHREGTLSFRNYGARGIRVCDRWRESFASFLEDMGRKPTPQHTIDRVNNDGNYEPGNCRWATRRQQSLNTRVNRLVSYDGREMPLALWAEETRIPYGTLMSRLDNGWPVERALKEPPDVRKRNRLYRGD